MAITQESKKALKKRKYEILDEVAKLDDHRYKIQRRVDKEQKKLDAIGKRILKLEAEKKKIEGDMK